MRGLREREQEYQKSLRHSPLVLARTDASLRYEWILNPHPDFDPSHVVGKRDDELASGPGIAALVSLKRHVLDRGVQERREITFMRAGAPRTYDITATPFRDRLGSVTHVITAALDITERKQAEEELRKSEERYRTLFESIEEGYCVLEMLYDDDGRAIDYRFLETNPAFERHTGLVDAAGKTAYELVPGLERRWVDLYARVAETGEPVHFVEAAASMGRWFEVDAFRVGPPELRRVALVFSDITERKQAEQALRELNDTLEERVEQRTRQVQELTYRLTMAEQAERNRISQVLHDNLQQQLYGIQMKLGFARRALEAGELDRLRQDLDDAQTWLREGIDITRNLTVDLSPPVLHDEGLVATLQWLQTRMRDLHGLEVAIESDQDFHMADQDARVLLFQIVRELLFNVAKHADTDRAVVALRDRDGRVEIVVSDEGQGFDAATVVEEGFGLFSVRERLQLLGGRMKVASEPEQGTRVTLDVPIHIDRASKPV